MQVSGQHPSRRLYLWEISVWNIFSVLTMLCDSFEPVLEGHVHEEELQFRKVTSTHLSL